MSTALLKNFKFQISNFKFVILLVTSYLLLVTFTTPVFAKDPEIPSSTNWNSFLQSDHTLNGTIIDALTCGIAASPYGTTGCVFPVFAPNGTSTDKIMYNGEGGGAIGATTGFMAQVYDNPPISGTQYMAQAVKDGFGLQPKSAYAQVTGSGAGVLQPVQKIWQFFRNIAYAGFILVFLVVGFMIMLRQKINPQTVVTIQAALPGLVIGLILVTFSYFLAGLFVDMAFLLSQFSGILFIAQIGNPPNGAPAAVTDLLNNHNIASMFGNFVVSGHLLGAAGEIGNGINEIVFPGIQGGLARGLIGALAACLNPIGLAGIAAGTAVAPGVGTAVAIGACSAIGGVGGAAAGGTIISGIVYLILLIGLLQAMVRLIFGLVMAYVQIILMTIFGPIIILLSALPGRGGTLALWWKPLLANSLIFPAVFIFFLIIATILGMGEPWFLSSGLSGGFGQALPLFGGTPIGFARAILAYGLLLAAPGIPDFIRNALGAKTDQILANAANKGIGVGAQGAGLFGATVGRGGYQFTGGTLEAGFRGRTFGDKLRSFRKRGGP